MTMRNTYLKQEIHMFFKIYAMDTFENCDQLDESKAK